MKRCRRRSARAPKRQRERDLFSLHWRRNLVLLALAAFSAVTVYRIHQIYNDGRLRALAVRQHLRVEKIPAHRGMIIDRNGTPLAVSKPMATVWAQPLKLAEELRRRPDKLALLAQLLDRPQVELAQRVDASAAEQRRRVDAGELSRGQPIRLWVGSSPGIDAALRRLRFDNVWTVGSYWRYYPDGEIASHVIGLTDKDENPLSGLEKTYNIWLSGTSGQVRMIKDRRSDPVEFVSEIAPRPGKTLHLSLDRRLQYLLYRSLKRAYQAHNAKAAYGVLLEATSGEVLALVNQPGTDPNDYAGRRPERLRNRAAVDLFEPGSTMKPFAVALALERRAITAESVIDTNPGWLRIGRFTVRDVHRYGRLDVTGVIAKSSNVGMAKIAQLLEPEQLWSLYSRLGFGTRTALKLTGELNGRLRHYADWSDSSLPTHTYGYGLSVTALQLAQAYACLAADGVRYPLSLQPVPRPVSGGERVMSARTSRQVLAMLERAIQADGTGTRAAVNGYRVAGKTGTVRKPNPAGGYYKDRHYSVFAGIVPVSRPQYVMVVVVDEPRGKSYYGGSVAAPVFGEVMRQALPLLGVPPDPETLPVENLVQLAARGN